MKIFKDFVAFTNLKGIRIKTSLVFILASLLYCVLLSFVQLLVYAGNSAMYYLALYLFVIWSAFVYMILLFQLLMKKRGEEKKLAWKSYVLPLIATQSIYFVVMIGIGLLTFMMAGNSDSTLAYSLLTPVCILLTILYVPLQMFSFFGIYDGERNPLRLIKKAFMKTMKHYRSCFYALLTLVLIVLFYQILMNVCFAISNSFVSFSAVQDIMIRSNPFIDFVQYLSFAFQNNQLWLPTIVSFVYGVVMCIVYVYYSMVMVCAYDEDIKV